MAIGFLCRIGAKKSSIQERSSSLGYKNQPTGNLSCVLVFKMTKVEQVLSQKPGSRAPMGALVRTLLGLFCLLLAPAGASEEGEVCLGWLPIPVEGSLPFRCPQRPDGKAGQFCCGTCIAPYCCDSEGARLDQEQCLQIWRALEFLVRAIMARRLKATLPILQDLQTTPTSNPKARGVRSITGDTTPTPRPPFNVVRTTVALTGVVCAVLILPLLVFILCKCCFRIQGNAACPYRRRGAAPPPDYPMVVRSDPRLPHSPPPSYSPLYSPLFYEERPPLSPYSQVGPSIRSRGDGATAEEATTQGPTAFRTKPHTGLTGAPAAAREVTPVQEAASGGDHASCVVPSAPGLISTQPPPLEMTISVSVGIIRETEA